MPRIFRPSAAARLNLAAPYFFLPAAAATAAGFLAPEALADASTALNPSYGMELSLLPAIRLRLDAGTESTSTGDEAALSFAWADVWVGGHFSIHIRLLGGAALLGWVGDDGFHRPVFRSAWRDLARVERFPALPRLMYVIAAMRLASLRGLPRET